MDDEEFDVDRCISCNGTGRRTERARGGTNASRHVTKCQIPVSPGSTLLAKQMQEQSALNSLLLTRGRACCDHMLKTAVRNAGTYAASAISLPAHRSHNLEMFERQGPNNDHSVVKEQPEKKVPLMVDAATAMSHQLLAAEKLEPVVTPDEMGPGKDQAVQVTDSLAACYVEVEVPQNFGDIQLASEVKSSSSAGGHRKNEDKGSTSEQPPSTSANTNGITDQKKSDERRRRHRKSEAVDRLSVTRSVVTTCEVGTEEATVIRGTKVGSFVWQSQKRLVYENASSGGRTQDMEWKFVDRTKSRDQQIKRGERWLSIHDVPPAWNPPDPPAKVQSDPGYSMRTKNDKTFSSDKPRMAMSDDIFGGPFPSRSVVEKELRRIGAFEDSSTETIRSTQQLYPEDIVRVGHSKASLAKGNSSYVSIADKHASESNSKVSASKISTVESPEEEVWVLGKEVTSTSDDRSKNHSMLNRNLKSADNLAHTQQLKSILKTHAADDAGSPKIARSTPSITRKEKSEDRRK